MTPLSKKDYTQSNHFTGFVTKNSLYLSRLFDRIFISKLLTTALLFSLRDQGGSTD